MNYYHVNPTTESDSCSDEESCRGSNLPHSSTLINPTRKRRRGIIEKRRRDRINTSLTELKRLVPQALEKSGSAKLEKAEILQMTVDHLKNLNANNMGYDQSRVARDYHSMGFRECATEVSRYLVSIEGLDIQDPLRIRLMSHLQMFMTQRTTPTTPVAPPPPPPPPTVPSTPNYPHQWGYNPPSGYGYEDPLYFNKMAQPPASSTTTSMTSPTNYTMTMTATAAGVPPAPIGFTASVQPIYHHPPATSEAVTSTSSNSPSYTNLSSSKPYRPWGAEMAC